jgi:hypothetical protein
LLYSDDQSFRINSPIAGNLRLEKIVNTNAPDYVAVLAILFAGMLLHTALPREQLSGQHPAR